MRNAIFFHPRPSVNGEEPYPTQGDRYAEHSGSKGVNLEKQSPILRCECHAYGMNGSGLVCLKTAPSGIPGDLPEVIQPYQLWELYLVDLITLPLFVGP